MEAGKVKGEKGSKALTSSPLQSATHCTRLKDVKVREEMQNPEDGVFLSDASSIKTTVHKSESFQEREKSKTDIGIENKDKLQTDCPKEAGKDSRANNGHVESKSVFRGQRGDQSNASISGKSSSTSEKRRRSSSGDDTERTDCSKAQTLGPVFCFETTSISSLPGNKISEYITTSQKKQPGGCQRYDKDDGSDADESDFVSSTTLREKRTTLRKRSAKGEISTSHMSATEEKTVTSNSSNTQDLCVSSNQKEKSVERSDHNHQVYASGDENSTQLPKVVRNAKQGESNPITASDESDLCRTNRGLEVRDNPLTEEICPGGKDSDDCNKSQSGECLPKGDDVSSFTSKDSSSEDRTDTVSCPEKIVEVGDTLRVDGDVEVEDSLNDGGQQDWTGGGGHQDWTGEEDEREEEEDSPTNTLPEREISLDEGVITEGEKKAMPEFFDYTSSAKTPERYLTIRNHIIKCWQRSKPEYLTKTYARNGLRKSGDVNVIGQIHGYLETVGAINFGTNPSYRVRLKKRRSSKEIWSQQSSDAGAKARRLESMRPRRPMAGKKTEVDLQEPTEQVSHREPKQKKVKQPRPPAYDPFKLVQCSQFSTDLPAPFSVKISGDVMVTMDLHSHLSTTEVIGLLGGQFDATTCELDMKMAKPCKSLSTGMQCEMDPVSQTEACLAIQESGCSVIGWYHSHPTFAPNPSIRDIETQTDFQEWFSQDGERPFIGVIVSPYHSRQHVHSKVNCITVSRQWSSNGHTWKPYKFDFSIYQSDQVEESHQKLVSLASSLIDEFAEYKYRVEMLWVCPGQTDMTYLEKMLRSLEANLCGEEETKRETVGKLRQLVLHRFESKCSTHITDAATHITHIPVHITDTPTHFTDTTMD
ncbi:uncharacterized protein [Diadema setosum]|uniref:uncharacterized protein isoform X2 n=1 Tax=Diadema setosum TaxID=31175 RepID=UPI003B3BB8FB